MFVFLTGEKQHWSFNDSADSYAVFNSIYNSYHGSLYRSIYNMFLHYLSEQIISSDTFMLPCGADYSSIFFSRLWDLHKPRQANELKSCPWNTPSDEGTVIEREKKSHTGAVSHQFCNGVRVKCYCYVRMLSRSAFLWNWEVHYFPCSSGFPLAFSATFPDAYCLPFPPLNHRWQQDQLWACPDMDGGKVCTSDSVSSTLALILFLSSTALQMCFVFKS